MLEVAFLRRCLAGVFLPGAEFSGTMEWMIAQRPGEPWRVWRYF